MQLLLTTTTLLSFQSFVIAGRMDTPESNRSGVSLTTPSIVPLPDAATGSASSDGFSCSEEATFDYHQTPSNDAHQRLISDTSYISPILVLPSNTPTIASTPDTPTIACTPDDSIFVPFSMYATDTHSDSPAAVRINLFENTPNGPDSEHATSGHVPINLYATDTPLDRSYDELLSPIDLMNLFDNAATGSDLSDESSSSVPFESFVSGDTMLADQILSNTDQTLSNADQTLSNAPFSPDNSVYPPSFCRNGCNLFGSPFPRSAIFSPSALSLPATPDDRVNGGITPDAGNIADGSDSEDLTQGSTVARY